MVPYQTDRESAPRKHASRREEGHMTTQTTRHTEIAAALAREIAAVEDEYRTALQMAARDLQPTKAGMAAVEGSVASGPLVELDAAAAMTIHSLETRLDQLK